MTRQPVHPEEGASTHHQPQARARAKAKARTKAKAQEAPNGAKQHGEKEKARCLHLMTPSGSGIEEGLKIHCGHRA